VSEIRKHYFLDEYCIVAAGRGRRPSDFSSSPEVQNATSCVFCAGKEDKTPPALAIYKDGEILRDSKDELIRDWQIRCIPNLYPALSPEGAGTPYLSGYGFHEVIIETPQHEKRLTNFTDEEMDLLMKAYRDRVMHYWKQPDIQFVSLFKNWGKQAGASLEHTHSQLIALPLIPPSIKRESDVIHAKGKCPYCEIVRMESSNERSIYENEHLIAFAPYCSKVPFEIWFLPKAHVSNLLAMSEEILHSLGIAIRYVLSRMETVLASPAYNYMFFQLLNDDPYHLNIRLQPVTSKMAGFEKNTDIFINTMPPEKAAEYLNSGISEKEVH
jgi:UDPglucose--hexose-1-phosphate uridylyltransferase